jgi:hypothetical protein
LKTKFELVGLPSDCHGRNGTIRIRRTGHFLASFRLFLLFRGHSAFKEAFNQKVLKFSILGLSRKTNPNTVEMVKRIFFVKRGVRHVLGATGRPYRHQQEGRAEGPL